MNKVKEILNRMFNRLVKWKVHMIATLAMVIVTVLGVLDFCNYIGQDKLITLHCLILFLTITAICLFWWWWIDEESFKWMVIVVMIIIAILGAWDAYHCKCFVGDGKPITLDYLVGFLLTMATIYLFWRRAKNQEEQIKIEDFNAAVNLLGSEQTSARTGAIYSLYRQAVEHKKYREQIVQILCSHIRSKTQESDYQKEYKKRPSSEIQMTIDLLFREIKSTGKIENKGLYPQFRHDLPKANLSHAYCVGADFIGADCQGVDFGGVSCREADFRNADCRGAYFGGVDCQKAKFMDANFQEANFLGADCQGADFMKSHCQEAKFEGADCQKAEFIDADCREAYFGGAHCQEAKFEGADCQKAEFIDADCQEAKFVGAHCQEANFKGANCQKVKFFGVDCQVANFERVSCQGADFRNADCRKVNFRNASCQGADFWGASCQGVSFLEADCQGVDFGEASCQGADFSEARCEGADFLRTNCQGVNFFGVHCQGADFGKALFQGAYGSAQYSSLQSRIGKDTELDKVMVLEGLLSEGFIDAIEEAQEYCPPDWYIEMHKILIGHKDKEEKRGVPEGIISGVLEDSEELQKIIK